MGVCGTGDRVDGQNYYMRRMQRQYGDKIEFVFPDVFVGRIFHDHARNAYVKQFLDTDCDMIWFLDSDIVPSERLLDLITVHGDKWDMAGAPYAVWMTQAGDYPGPQLTYTVYREVNGALCPSSIPESGIDFVEGIATGCIFIKRNVIEKMQKPYFEFKYNPETREIVEGEDLGFCIKANKLGFKFFVDFSMLCHHYKKVDMLDVSNFLEYQRNQIIDSCDREIRRIIAKKQLEKLNRPKPSLIQQVKPTLILPK